MSPDKMLALASAHAIAQWAIAWGLASSLPALAWTAFSGTVPSSMRIASVVAGFAVWWSLEAPYQGLLALFAGSIGYFWLVAVIVHSLSRRAPVRFTRAGWFCVCAVLCALLPRLLVSAEVSVLLLPFGLEMLMSAYSYFVESDGRRRDASTSGDLKECLLFLLVNPALVFTPPTMGTSMTAPNSSWIGSARIAMGCVAMGFAVVAAQSYGWAEVRLAQMGIAESRESQALIAVEIVALYFAAYWGHSGAVSVRLGWMRLLGWKVPERYHYPFLADSPLDFWKRWNIHWSTWFRYYVFDRGVRTLRRKRPRWPMRAHLVLGVTLVFFASGIFHDVAAYVDSLQFSLGATAGFLFYALGLLAWRGGKSVLPSKVRNVRMLVPVGRVFGGIVTLGLLIALTWFRW